MQPSSWGQGIQDLTRCTPSFIPGTAWPSLPAASSRPTEPADRQAAQAQTTAGPVSQLLRFRQQVGVMREAAHEQRGPTWCRPPARTWTGPQQGEEALIGVRCDAVGALLPCQPLGLGVLRTKPASAPGLTDRCASLRCPGLLLRACAGHMAGGQRVGTRMQLSCRPHHVCCHAGSEECAG